MIRRNVLSLPAASAALLLLTSSGCASYTRSKIELVQQSRRGIDLVRQAMAQRQAALDEATADRRARLDAAFDVDVAAHATSLTPQWVLEARKAYAVGIDAIALQLRNSQAAQASTLTDLDAIDAALAQLQRMHELELQFTLPEVTR